MWTWASGSADDAELAIADATVGVRRQRVKTRGGHEDLGQEEAKDNKTREQGNAGKARGAGACLSWAERETSPL